MHRIQGFKSERRAEKVLMTNYEDLFDRSGHADVDYFLSYFENVVKVDLSVENSAQGDD